MAQTLQKVDYADLASMLAQINNNFAIIQNSPFFKGLPGEPGQPGQRGNIGPRGNKIFATSYDRFVIHFPELQGQSINSINADWINDKLTNDDEYHTNLYKIYDSLGIVDDSLIDNDVIIFQSDMSLWQYDLENNRLYYSGIKFVSNANAVETINNLIQSSLSEYISSLETATIYLKQYDTIATNDGSQGVSPSRINGITTYIPHLPIAGVPSRKNVTEDIDITNDKRHKYFAIDDYYTNLDENYENNSPFGLTMIMGSVREYVRTLKNGTRQNMTGNIVNPTYDKMPSLVVMQNNYNSGILIGHRQSDSMSDYGVIYKNSDGQLCLRREHRWPSSRTSQSVTELIIGSSEFIFNGNINLIAGNKFKSDFLDSYTVTGKVKIGYGMVPDSILEFDAASYIFKNLPSNILLEIDENNNIRRQDSSTGIVHSVSDNGDIPERDPLGRKKWFDDNFRLEGPGYDNNNLRHNVPNERTLSLMYETLQDEIDQVWRKNEFYPLISERTFSDGNIIREFSDKIRSIRMSDTLFVGSHEHNSSSEIPGNTLNTYYIPLEVNCLVNRGLSSNDLIRIGMYFEERSDGNGGSTLHKLPSKLDLHMDWNRAIIYSMPSYSVFTVNEQQEIDQNYQYANPYDTYEDDVYRDLSSRIDTDDFKNPDSFDKYAHDSWYDSDVIERGGYSAGNIPDKDEQRFLTGRHFATIMRCLGTIVSWAKDTFVRKSEFNKIVERDLVPYGSIIAWNPQITNYIQVTNARTLSVQENTITGNDNGISSAGTITGFSGSRNGLTPINHGSSIQPVNRTPSQTLVQSGNYVATSVINANTDFKLPLGWVPCIGKSLFEVSNQGPRDIGTIHAIYRVPDLRDKVIVGYQWNVTSSINSPHITGNANYQPDMVTLDSVTVIPRSKAPSISSISTLTASSLMSETTGSRYKHVERVKGLLSNSQIETENYYPYFDTANNNVIDASTSPKADKFQMMVPAVRLVYIMKAPKPAEGHSLYMQINSFTYIRVYPTPSDDNFSDSSAPFIINELNAQAILPQTVVVNNNQTTVFDNGSEDTTQPNTTQHIQEGLNNIVANNDDSNNYGTNGVLVSSLDVSRLSESERTQYAELLNKMGVQI